MKIEIDIPRPGLALTMLAACAFAFLWARDTGLLASVLSAPESSVTIQKSWQEDPANGAAVDERVEPEAGGDALIAARSVREGEDQVKQARSMQQILDQKREIVEYQLRLLEAEQETYGAALDAETADQLRKRTLALTELLSDQKKAEQFVLSSLNQVWSIQGRSEAEIRPGSNAFGGFSLWPASPEGGISAKFHEEDYPFPFVHDAIDIRVPQGTNVRAPAAGKVIEVKDGKDLNFHYVRIEHEAGVVTLYGHISEALVQEGQYVKAGDIIAKSGGMPGTRGAGAFTTGPHLHFGLKVDGGAVDPVPYLPR